LVLDLEKRVAPVIQTVIFVFSGRAEEVFFQCDFCSVE
jgi:hypothetical protein